MKKRKLYIFLTAVVVTLSAILLSGCNGGGGTPPTEKWVTLADKSKNEEMFVHIRTTEYTGKDETQLENLKYYKTTDESSDNHPKIIALKENKLQFDTYEGFGFSFEKAILKTKFDIMSEKDQEFEFDFIYVDDQTKKWVTVNQTINTQANKPFTVILDVKDFEGVTNASSVKVRLKNIPMIVDVFQQQFWYNTNIKWTIQNVAFINK